MKKDNVEEIAGTVKSSSSLQLTGWSCQWQYYFYYTYRPDVPSQPISGLSPAFTLGQMGSLFVKDILINRSPRINPGFPERDYCREFAASI
jgi:hypothetical protein